MSITARSVSIAEEKMLAPEPSAPIRALAGTSQSTKVTFANGGSIALDFNNGGPTLDEVEQTILQAAYDHWDHNLSRAARCLGITREALRYRLNKSTNGAARENAS